MGSEIPKPFIKLSGKTILQRSVECFLDVKGLRQIIVATSKEWIDDCVKILENINASGVDLKVIEGGTERQYSIQNALDQLDNEIELIAIHDAVRPFVELEKIEDCFKTAAKFGGAILAVPAKDTIKRIDGELVIKQTPKRSELWQAQTPQVFKTELIKKAYSSAIENNYLGTDDSSLVERIGGAVKVVEGNRKNLKITFPIDLRVAEYILEDNH
jgi:2-C-methyl-D-erythritol 4-phosphate cytidylyltransferase